MLSNNKTILSTDENCYICKAQIVKSHFFYQHLCPSCGDYNYRKRFQKADLCGYTALVTGGRIKIGYETALKLLRNGANVIVTTRFPKNALLRFSKENDYTDWQNRLDIYGIDLRHIKSVNHFIKYILYKTKKLDIIINNAAQTVRRPPIFYKHLIDEELSINNQQIEALNKLCEPINHDSLQEVSQIEEMKTFFPIIPININNSALLSQIPILDGDEITESEFFPLDQFDKDGQQEDRRPINSWMLKLEDVDLMEFFEVLYINLIAPFLFNSKLKNLLIQNYRPSFIINVTAMEGNFYNPDKSEKHVHTNMAKAALNMMTRTSAQDYSKD